MARGRHADRPLEAGMVAPVHLPYPGGEHERMWLQEVVGEDGGRPPFSRGCGALIER